MLNLTCVPGSRPEVFLPQSGVKGRLHNHRSADSTELGIGGSSRGARAAERPTTMRGSMEVSPLNDVTEAVAMLFALTRGPWPLKCVSCELSGDKPLLLLFVL